MGPYDTRNMELHEKPVSYTHLEIIRDIAALHPDFISVTYGAGGSTSKRTVEIASKIQDTYGIPAMAHLTCVSSVSYTHLLIGGTIAIFHSAQDPVGHLPVPFKIEDRIHNVFQDLWSRNRAVFVDVPNQEDRDFQGFCRPH